VLSTAPQHVHEVVVRIDVVQPAGGQQALHNADVLGSQLSPAEQPVLLTHRDHAQRTLKVVRVDRYLRVVQVDRQADSSLADIRQRTEEGTARQESLLVELLVDPGEEAFVDGFRLLLSASELGLPRQAIVRVVELGDDFAGSKNRKI